ncbi:hypothetical protein BJ546DRAFT_1061510 [Cryomyces antarcticus]
MGSGKYPHPSIYHETYDVPRSGWESIYVNSAPTLIAAKSHKATMSEPRGKDEEKRTAWLSPTIDARKGVPRSSAGRMSRSEGEEHEKYSYDPFAETEEQE